MKMLFFVSLFTLSSCGKDDGLSEDDRVLAKLDEPAVGLKTLNLVSSRACTSANLNEFVYVTADGKFYTCQASGWTEATVTNSRSPERTVDSNYRFHTDTYNGQPEICQGCDSTIGTIQLVKYSDGSALVSSSGYVSHANGGSDFRHVFFLPASTNEQIYFAKVSSYINDRVRYRINLHSNPLKIYVMEDVDGIFANDPEAEFTLTKQ